MNNKKYLISRKRSAGTILVLTTITLTVLLTVTGLALDVGRSYGVKAKLNSALDAAALAAAMAISEGHLEAEKAAKKYFEANIPNDYLGSTISFDPTKHLTIDFDESTGDATINISATADMPNYFLPIIGRDNLGTSAQAQTIRKAVDLAFVVDNTGSLKGSGDAVIARSKDFVNKFHKDYDRLSLTHYAYGAKEAVAFTSQRGFDLTTVEGKINAFKFSGYTNASEGMWTALNAHRKLKATATPSSMRVIVFFTDGSPNTFASTFKFKDMDTSGNPEFYASGSLRSNDSKTGSVAGLWKHNKISEDVDGKADLGTKVDDWLVELPEYYDPRKKTDLDYNTEFPLTKTEHPKEHREISKADLKLTNNADLYKTVNRISRNLPEDMAAKAREEGIYVFTLGLGYRLLQASGPDDETGEDMLKRMANIPGSDTYDSFKPEGVYCYAKDKYALAPCFEKIIAAIIRLTI